MTATGATVLMNAVKNGNNLTVTQYLIEQDADIHALDQPKKRITPDLYVSMELANSSVLSKPKGY